MHVEMSLMDKIAGEHQAPRPKALEQRRQRGAAAVPVFWA
jgi:hypothetical protein